jgi:hypothetical protein
MAASRADQGLVTELASKLPALVVRQSFFYGREQLRRDAAKSLFIAADGRHLRDDRPEAPVSCAQHLGMAAGIARPPQSNAFGINFRPCFQE